MILAIWFNDKNGNQAQLLIPCSALISSLPFRFRPRLLCNPRPPSQSNQQDRDINVNWRRRSPKTDLRHWPIISSVVRSTNLRLINCRKLQMTIFWPTAAPLTTERTPERAAGGGDHLPKRTKLTETDQTNSWLDDASCAVAFLFWCRTSMKDNWHQISTGSLFILVYYS